MWHTAYIVWHTAYNNYRLIIWHLIWYVHHYSVHKWFLDKCKYIDPTLYLYIAKLTKFTSNIDYRNANFKVLYIHERFQLSKWYIAVGLVPCIRIIDQQCHFRKVSYKICTSIDRFVFHLVYLCIYSFFIHSSFIHCFHFGRDMRIILWVIVIQFYE